MATRAQCQVERCKFPATAMHRLKEPSGAFDFPADVAVCDIHQEQLSDPATEWLLLNEREGRRLLVGPMLAELNEYILIEPISGLTVHMASRDFSHPEHTGYHIPLKVRRRGGAEETLTLVIPPDLLSASAEYLHGIAKRSAPEPKSGDQP